MIGFEVPCSYSSTDQLLSNNYSAGITFSPPDLLREIADREFEPIFDKFLDITDGKDMGCCPSASDLVSSSEDLNPKNIVVGIREDVIQLKEQRLIMPLESKLEIIPIVGMGGIGKTTLAQILYNDQRVVSCFDTRAWVAISQSYNEKEILLGLLKCIMGKLSDNMVHKDKNDTLGMGLYKQLWGRRYLIVLDDMWNSEAWDCVRMFFPDENNGSRILVTTREQNVAKYIEDSESLHHQMKLLNDYESWELLCQKVFLEGRYNLELEKIGKDIASHCKGLPLAIHVVSGVLLSSEKTQEAWRQVAKDASCFFNHKQFSNILSLSYNYLPNYLKPCFLYIGAFRKDRQIQASVLIRLWMAEGFLKPILGVDIEETAKEYLKELVERNLLSVAQRETKRKAKSYIMHDLVRDLCISKAREEKFVYVGTDSIKDLNQNEMLRLRLSVHDSYDEFTLIIGFPLMPSSILFFANLGDLSWLDKYVFGCMRVLKVLHMLEAQTAKLPKAMEKLVNLRYLAACISNSDTYFISNLCNLQNLILCLRELSLPVNVKELLDMPQLRHIKFKEPYTLFSLEDGESVDFVNEELQTLSGVVIDNSFPRILKVFPNLKKLGILSEISTINLSYLSRLQILKCSRYSKWTTLNLIFPPSLKKLTLHKCGISSEFLHEIGRLPNLEVFKVKWCGYERVWKPAEQEFQQLRLLLLEKFSCLKKWVADETHYPRLEHLIINDCEELQEIPSGIGDIPTLEIIEVHYCSKSAVESARKIQEEQIQFGNDTLQVRVKTFKVLPSVAGTLADAASRLLVVVAALTRTSSRGTSYHDETMVEETYLRAVAATMVRAQAVVEGTTVVEIAKEDEAMARVKVALAEVLATLLEAEVRVKETIHKMKGEKEAEETTQITDNHEWIKIHKTLWNTVKAVAKAIKTEEIARATVSEADEKQMKRWQEEKQYWRERWRFLPEEVRFLILE